ncbi:hypothetical protein [Streptomyces sp. NPDC048659]|uniref:hypothetical protein n=1 Tax=Streptomyces sp. NPDC048659 TaxID=3155489 RepID=UPI003416917E
MTEATTDDLDRAVADASAPAWTTRVRAGRDLAPYAGLPRAAEALLALLLDPEDTAVTRATAEALTRAGTADALRFVARAAARADAQQADWLATGAHDALPETTTEPTAPRDALAEDPDEAVRRGAELLAARPTG